MEGMMTTDRSIAPRLRRWLIYASLALTSLVAVPGRAFADFNEADFGGVSLGQSAPDHTFFRNNGHFVGLVYTASITGDPDFQIVANNCGDPLPDSSFCTFDVRFTPGALGPRTAVLTIVGTGGGSTAPPEVITLTGVGLAPTITCPASITTGNAPGQCGATVNYSPPTSQGTTGEVTCVPPSGSFFPVGTTTVNCSSQSGAVCSFDVTVNDAEGPAIGGASASPSTLGPPDHRMVPVTVQYTLADGCTPSAQLTSGLSVQSNEPVNGTGDGDKAPDWQVLDAHHLLLRAERSGTGTGRIYTITITGTDSKGNVSTRTVSVVVPHG
jgi:hypothetical protein